MKCPSCGQTDLVRDTRDMPYTYKGEATIIPAITGDFCPACDEVVLDANEARRTSALMRGNRSHPPQPDLSTPPTGDVNWSVSGVSFPFWRQGYGEGGVNDYELHHSSGHRRSRPDQHPQGPLGRRGKSKAYSRRAIANPSMALLKMACTGFSRLFDSST